MEVVLKLLFYMLCILLPLHMLIFHEFHRWQASESARRLGVVVRRLDALDEASEVIGSYCGAEIHRTVTFHGVQYEFFGVVPTGEQETVHDGELYLPPGLLYVNCDGS